MKLSDFNAFTVPEELIAQVPATPRDRSRLMVVRRDAGTIAHHVFAELPEILAADYTLVLNNSRVVRARLVGRDGARERVFYVLKALGDRHLAVGDDLAGVPEGTVLTFADSPLTAAIARQHPDGTAEVAFAGGDVAGELDRLGTVPLPPYITTMAGEDQYQTVYAKEDGSVAAPTAGLHFTPEVFERLAAKGVGREEVTLHVGYGTFAHVDHEELAEHPMHGEPYTLDAGTAERLNAAKAQGRKLLTVGTTATRVVESTADESGALHAGSGETRLFIYPPYRFKAVDALLTNFHMPGLTPIMLVAAFAGYDLTMEAYRVAIAEKYRFYSFGDAMLVL